jgi:ubiquinone/menaquinone biosynthesis C-methylase UbiE
MGIHARLFAATYDPFMAKTERELLGDLRLAQLASAHGDVLEVGAGTGANLPAYGPQVRALTLTEPQDPMLKRLRRRVDAVRPQIPVTVLRAPAEDLPFEDDSFDVVVSSLVLCGATDQQLALRQIRRVLRPGGSLLFIEHVRFDDPQRARHQDKMNWLNRFLVCCDCNRPTLESIREAGFTASNVQELAMPHAPSFIGPVLVGSAIAPTANQSATSTPAADAVPASGLDQDGFGQPST